MNEIDKTTFERFAKRFARIERHVPDPPPHAAADTVLARRAPARSTRPAALLGVAILVVASVALAVLGSQTQPSPSPTAGAVSNPTESPALAAPTRPTPGELQHAHPQLGGRGWTITDLEGKPQSLVAYLSFWGGPTGGPANGDASADCWFIAFEYAYDPNGTAITFFPSEAGEGSGSHGCSQAALEQYAALFAALSRVAEWRQPAADQFELLDVRGAIVLKGGPMPPLPTPPPGGDCGEIPVDICQDAATQAFNFGSVLSPGQTIVSWRVRETIYTSCPSAIDPKYDVIFELANPASETIAVVGDAFGKLHACGPY